VHSERSGKDLGARESLGDNEPGCRCATPGAQRCHMDIQHEKGGFTMRPRTLSFFALAALLGAAVAVLPALAAAPSEAKLEVNENCVEADWPCWAAPGSGSPASKVTIAAGGEVMFTDHASTAAAVVWMGSAPACTGVPTSAMAGWEGKCKFEQPGTYKFASSTLWPEYTKYEIVVEGPATGTTPTTTTTTTPTTTTTTAPRTPSEPSDGSPLEGGSRALELAGSQHGSTVHGRVKVSQVGSGGRLEVGLFATGTSLAKARHPAKVRVGRLVRSSLQAGSVSFAVPLTAKGKAALRRHQRLALTVKITLTPLHGAAVTITRVVVVRA
jgi:plastocyanin